MPPTIASRNVPERPIASENIDSVVAQSVSDAELGLKLFYQLGQIERTKDDADTREQVLHELRRNAAAVGFAAQFWLASLHPHLTGLTKGQVVVIDLVSGRFVVASSRLAGVDAFEAEFGIDTTVGWLHQIGGGVVLGRHCLEYWGALTSAVARSFESSVPTAVMDFLRSSIPASMVSC